MHEPDLAQNDRVGPVPGMGAGALPRAGARSKAGQDPGAGTGWPGTARDWAVDAAFAAAALAIEVTVSHHQRHDHGAPGTLAYVLLGVGGAALLARRRYPVAVLAVTVATAIWAGALGASQVWCAVIVAFFTAVLARRRAIAIASLVVGYVASVWPPWLIGQAGHATVGFALGLAAGLMFLLIIAELIRSRGQRVGALERSREEELRRRASEERMRMARDLHDVVAHNISVINVQANTALHLMDRQPERARSALVTINDVSKQALVELRSVLGVLRDVDARGDAPRAPAPGLARLGDLVETAAAAGLDVRVHEDGQRGPLPADVDLTAYRIIQEALTNSSRHSGGTTATVRLGFGEGGLRVEVDDDGGTRGAGQPPGRGNGSGNGIAGMTERAAALGGTLEAGPRLQGGFRVRAWLPARGLPPNGLAGDPPSEDGLPGDRLSGDELRGDELRGRALRQGEGLR
jgi:signal transduction histidine kinase